MLVAMLDLTREKAEQVMRRGPWLASMTEPFRTELLRHAHLQKFAPDQVVYRHGDAVGGMYGLVAGSLTINSAPPDAASRLIHLGMPGAWTGEGPFLTGQPRRVELRALGGAWMMHVPLDALEQMMARDPGVSRAIAMNTVFTVDVLLRIIHDLQKRDVGRRIASVLQRASWVGDMPIPLSQTDLGIMANASRQQVNTAMQRFARAGWVSYTYRSVTVSNSQALRRFSEGDGSEW
ncbi:MULTISPECIES: Crp/Fnr family transcriptional regulator [Sinorhizobium]|jgi:CRP/FNR family cyclic AMP-dependent transcriptional regulator|uniref:Crp/Fnr family transcriptional regulator n=1 Tax=Sinorhizobium TaxID=28105 RepID=UPI0018DF2689|nr:MULTISPECIES: Crp/Fnr family transcriptional regulator [Sinorhizobium]WQO48596.1 Crp/Fnr family transcriptional regulator [Sinorhizobium medicae]WQO70696.1 Crp/Fnr family transcriptional regulator [Sinorhizobium medicae]